jgi:hypothetical protein
MLDTKLNTDVFQYNFQACGFLSQLTDGCGFPTKFLESEIWAILWAGELPFVSICQLERS